MEGTASLPLARQGGREAHAIGVEEKERRAQRAR